MTKRRDAKGRTANPESPVRCPVCREVFGKRGLSRHLQGEHDFSPADARTATQAAIDAARPLSELARECAGLESERRSVEQAESLSQPARAAALSEIDDEIELLRSQMRDAESDQ